MTVPLPIFNNDSIGSLLDGTYKKPKVEWNNFLRQPHWGEMGGRIIRHLDNSVKVDLKGIVLTHKCGLENLIQALKSQTKIREITFDKIDEVKETDRIWRDVFDVCKKKARERPHESHF